MAANPVVAYLLTENLAVSAAATAVAVVIVVGLASRRRLTGAALVAFNAVVLLSCAAHGELVLRLLFPEHVVPNLYAIRSGYYVNQPLLTQRFATAEYSASYYTDVQGFRIPVESDPHERLQEADWLVMGDSFTQGAQVEFSKLYSTLLYREFPDRIVLNAGISGLGLGQEYNFYMAEGRKLRPSLVILQIGSFNDFMNVEAPVAGPTEHLLARSALARLLLTPATDGEHLPLARWTEPFQPSRALNYDFNVFYRETSKRKRADLEAFNKTLESFAQEVTAGGARLLVVLLPTREQVYRQSLEQVLEAYGIAADSVDMQRPSTILKAQTARLGIGLLDLLPAFEAAGEGLFFEQDVHLTEKGHAVVGGALIEHLRGTEGQSETELLSEEFGAARYPTFSRDGRLVAFQAVRNGSSDLLLGDAELKSARWVSSAGVDEAHPSLSRDLTTLAFTSGQAASLRTDALLMRVDSSAISSLTPEPSVFGAIPSFSTTGREVAFAEWTIDSTSGLFTHPRIAVTEIATSRKTYLTDGRQEAWRPVFSPTDTQLAFIEQVNGQFDVHLLDLTTGVRTNLTDTAYDEWDPTFTPDGRGVVYAAKADGNWDLFMLDISTRRLSRLTRTTGDEWDPAVSPDGGTLLYGGRFGPFQGILRRPMRP